MTTPVGDRERVGVGWLLGNIALLVSFVLIGCCLFVRDEPSQTGTGLHSTIYPWWLWVLVVVGAGSAAASLFGRQSKPIQAGAPAVAAVAAAQLASSGVVAFRHWQPASGMGGTYGGRIHTLETLAFVVGLAGLLGVLICLWLLIRHRDLPQRTSTSVRAVSVTAGLIVAVGLPLGLALTASEMRLTRLGAVSLIYAWPWGLALIAVGWVSRFTGLAASGAVVVTAALAVIGPQMTDLVSGKPAPVFGAAAVLAFVVFIHRWTART